MLIQGLIKAINKLGKNNKGASLIFWSHLTPLLLAVDWILSKP